jgi:hypothetical protein
MKIKTTADLADLKSHVYCIQESREKGTNLVEGFLKDKVFGKNGDPGGGLVTGVDADLMIKTGQESEDSIFTQIVSSDINLLLINIYRRIQTKINVFFDELAIFIAKLRTDYPNSAILCIRDWNLQPQDFRLQEFAKYLELSIYIPDDGPTWRRGEAESVLDFAVGDKSLTLHSLRTRFNDTSDHRPIQFQVDMKWKPMQRRMVTKVGRTVAQKYWEQNPGFQVTNGDPQKIIQNCIGLSKNFRNKIITQYDPRYLRRKPANSFDESLANFIILQRTCWEETWKNWNNNLYNDSTKAREFVQRLTKYKIKREGEYKLLSR